MPSRKRAKKVTKDGAITPLLIKRVAAVKLVGFGITKFNELGNPLHRNFDPTFPKPVRRITPKGPVLFIRAAIVAWVSSLAQDHHSAELAANEAAYKSRV